jgi:lipid-binding SYLF domain-containing protein
MLVMNEREMRRLLEDKFTIGADATVATGPVGRSGRPDGVLCTYAART